MNHSRTKPRRLFLAACVATAFLCQAAVAQRLLVTTTTMTAARQAAKCYLQSVDIGYGAPLPGPEPLPGIAPVGPLLAWPDSGWAVQSSGPVWTGGEFEEAAMWTYASLFGTAPFRPLDRVDFAPGWRVFAGCIVPGETPLEAVVAMLGTAPREAGAWQGFVEFHIEDPQVKTPALTPEGKAANGERAANPWLRVSFPGMPATAVGLPRKKQVAVLCRDTFGRGVVLRVFDANTGAVPLEPYRFTGKGAADGVKGEATAVPSGLALSRNGEYLLVLISGYCLEKESGEEVSWLHVLSADTLTEVFEPLELPGSAHVEALPLQPADNDTCWVATQPPGTGFAYATLVHLAGQRIEKIVEYPLTGVSSSFHIGPAPSGSDVAVAMDNRLEIWPGGLRNGIPATFEGPIGVIQWTAEGLIIGEVARIHLIEPFTNSAAPSPKPVKTIQLQSGWVTDFVLLPNVTLPGPDSDADGIPDDAEALLVTSASSPDTDGDGIPDGSDPEPTIPSPRLQLPTAVIFHGEGVGQEIKAFSIDSAHGKTSSWKIAYDKQTMPWLVIHPLEGTLPGVVYMGVDPGRYTPGKLAWGNLTVSMTGTTPDKSAAGSPCKVQVRVLPEKRSDVRRILWLRAANEPGTSLRAATEDPHQLQALAELLAAPPHYFAHREAAGPFQEKLDPYTVVVLDAEAATRGAVTRQALLDYVKKGGALLFLGKYLPDAPETQLSEWLSTLGIQIDTSARVEGAFNANGNHWLCRNWSHATINDGCVLYDTEPASILVPGAPAHSAILVARSYGLGRIALLAGDTPLETAAMRTPERRLFAADLFHWLSSAGRDGENQDMDGDGLSDDLEDKNHNGIVDPGETDYLNADTDGDGIPDGMEDANLNGRSDEGETSPLNPDSNGNGILDGADFNPLPPTGSPCVDAVNPTEGPAEGGKVVTLVGRGFAPDATVWFGNRVSPKARFISGSLLLTETPPCESSEGGAVAVKVVTNDGKLEGVLPGGFHYGERSKATLRIETVSTSQEPGGGGEIVLALACPADAIIGHVDLVLETDPPGSATFGEVEAADPALTGQLASKADRPGTVKIVFTRNPLSGFFEGPIARIPWKPMAKKTKAKSVTAKITQPRVEVQNGQTLVVIVKNAAVLIGDPKS